MGGILDGGLSDRRIVIFQAGHVDEEKVVGFNLS
jgi:hypothetical protein